MKIPHMLSSLQNHHCGLILKNIRRKSECEKFLLHYMSAKFFAYDVVFNKWLDDFPKTNRTKLILLKEKN